MAELLAPECIVSNDHSNFLTNVFFEVEEVEMTKK